MLFEAAEGWLRRRVILNLLLFLWGSFPFQLLALIKEVSNPPPPAVDRVLFGLILFEHALGEGVLPGAPPLDAGISPPGVVEWLILDGVGVVFVVIDEVLTNGRVSVEIFLLAIMVFEVIDVVDSPALRMPFKLPLSP